MKIQEHKIRTIRFVNGTAILEETRDELEKPLKSVDSKLKTEFKMKMNKSKTKGW